MNAIITDEKDMQLHNHARAIEAMQDAIEDYATTIEQFRDLVASLQADLDVAREASQSHQQESQVQATQAAAALALNMKLQSTTTKNQAKAIDLEIKRLDAAQARELLSIVSVSAPFFGPLQGLHTYIVDLGSAIALFASSVRRAR